MAYSTNPVKVKLANGQSVGVEDFVDRNLWSVALIASAGSGDVTLFKYTKGQSVVGASNAATTADYRHTNVQYGGQMPQTDALEIRTIAYEFNPDVTKAALVQLAERVWTELYLGSDRPVYSFLARHAPPGSGLWGVTTENATYAWNLGEPNPTHRLKLNVPLVIRPGDQYRAEMRIQGGALTMACADVTMRLVLRGLGPTAI